MPPLAQSIRDAHDALGTFLADKANLDRLDGVSQAMADALRNGNKLLAIGNGGSCCDAMHFCEELTGRFRDEREPLAAIACTDPGHLTCVANDYGYNEVFSRWVRALGKSGDAIVLLSTSGNSANIIRASEAAADIGITRVALLGNSGGALAGACEHEWIVPGATADRIQEIHMLILHTLIEGIEQRLTG
ncbi:MAG: SIS domain-containing protein [Planctomycetota bacterium]